MFKQALNLCGNLYSGGRHFTPHTVESTQNKWLGQNNTCRTGDGYSPTHNDLCSFARQEHRKQLIPRVQYNVVSSEHGFSISQVNNKYNVFLGPKVRFQHKLNTLAHTCTGAHTLIHSFFLERWFLFVGAEKEILHLWRWGAEAFWKSANASHWGSRNPAWPNC